MLVGATSKLGVAIATSLCARGYDVTGLSRLEPSRDLFARHVGCDLLSPAALSEALTKATAIAPIDVMIYAAGVPAMGRTLDVPESRAREAFEVNFWALTRCVEQVLPTMVERRRGAVLAVLSLAAVRAVPFEAYYAASKAAAMRWLECVAHEAAPHGVQVTYLAPGFVDTGFYTRAGWFGMSPPAVKGSGVAPGDVAEAVMNLLDGRRASRVVGWRERAIVLADRAAPGLYDRWLMRRRQR